MSYWHIFLNNKYICMIQVSKCSYGRPHNHPIHGIKWTYCLKDAKLNGCRNTKLKIH